MSYPISKAITSLTLCAAAALFTLSAAPAFAQSRAEEAAPRNTWIDLHNRQKNATKKQKPEVVFIGDSITAGWNTANSGRAVWNEYFAPLKAANLGISGDRTENVIWRLDNGLFDGISPKVAVVMIGTNNSGRDDSATIAKGVAKVVSEIKAKSPSTKILLLGVFPRGEKPDNAQRLKLVETNKDLAKLADGKQVVFMDIGDTFLQADGTISKDVMYDYLHLTKEGYERWAKAINAKVKELL